MIKLGSRVRDHYTRFEGIAIARTEWLYGCARITVQPERLQEDGQPIKAVSFDEPQLEVLEERARYDAPHTAGDELRPGGDRAEPARGRD